MAETEEERIERLRRRQQEERLAASRRPPERSAEEQDQIERVAELLQQNPIGTEEMPLALSGQDPSIIGGSWMDPVTGTLRSTADMLSLGTADEISALMDSFLSGEAPAPRDVFGSRPLINEPGEPLVYAEDESPYERRLRYQRQLDQQIGVLPRIAGGLMGALMMPGAMARAGVSPVAKAIQSGRSILPAAVAEGAVLGGAYGLGSGEGMEGRLGEGAVGATLGGASGLLMGGIASWLNRRNASQAVRDIQRGLEQRAGEAYRAIRESTDPVSQDAAESLLIRAQRYLSENAHRARNEPRLAGDMRELERMLNSGRPLRLNEMEQLRRLLHNTANSVQGTERTHARTVANMVDDVIEEFGEGLPEEARAVWREAKNMELVQDTLEEAYRNAGTYSQSGLENSIRNAFRKLAASDKRTRFLSQEQRAAIQAVADGSPVDNFFRWLGKWKPGGVVSTAAGAGIGGAAAGVPGAVAVPVAGAAGRAAATGATMRRVDAALDAMMQRGAMPAPARAVDDLATLGSTGALLTSGLLDMEDFL